MAGLLLSVVATLNIWIWGRRSMIGLLLTAMATLDALI
jgi:hypothetical protein